MTKLSRRLGASWNEASPEDEVDEPEKQPSNTSAGTVRPSKSALEALGEALEAFEICEVGRAFVDSEGTVRSDAEKRIGLPL